MILVIAEKPSVAQTIAAVLGAKEKKDGFLTGSGYIVSWCVGHLVGLAEAATYGEQYKKWSYDSLPILPQEWKYTVASDKEKQFKTLKELMHRADVSEVVNACDAGREGELIFRFVYEMAGCKKPMRRLWISSMEDSAIKEGFSRLKNGEEYDALFASALCRAKADWLIGINATRLFSVLYNHTLNVGRVQTPTLKMLVDRDAAITTFKKEKYYHVRLVLSGAEAASEKLSDRSEADKLKAACEVSKAVCASLVKEKKTAAPPKLFDLTSLQRETNRIFGYTAKQTLDLAQSLYEKRLLTYPRTDSSFLTDDMGGTAADIIALLCEKLPFMAGADFTPEIAKVLDSKKVSDHHAIIPTMELAKADPDALPESEKNILTLAGARLLFATAEPHIYEAVTAVFSCADTEFTARGKTVLSDGWKEIEHRYRATLKDKPDPEDGENEGVTLPELSEGQSLPVSSCAVKDGRTTPPKHFTEDTLLSAMETAGKEDMPEDAERKGLGTPATRAAVIEKLVATGFAERRKAKKSVRLVPTEAGVSLITVLPEQLQSPLLTAEWEHRLKEIECGELGADEFLDGIQKMVSGLVRDAAPVDGAEVLFPSGRPVVGKCPRCGAEVTESKNGYFCERRSCKFGLWRDNRFLAAKKISLTKKMASSLLTQGRAYASGIYSEKTGKTYDAFIVLEDDGARSSYKLDFTK